MGSQHGRALRFRAPDGKMFKPRPALPTAVPLYPSIGPWYLGSFTMHGEAVVEVPPGPYTVIAERGTEYQRFEKHLLVAQGESAHLEIALKPWIRMSELGWWSGDLHVHRSPEDVSKLALAEDLNLSVLFMIWGNRNPWAGKPWPKDSHGGGSAEAPYDAPERRGRAWRRSLDVSWAWRND